LKNVRFLSFFIANTKGRHALTKIKTSHDRACYHGVSVVSAVAWLSGWYCDIRLDKLCQKRYCVFC
ncbi:hypothetical protein, partial [Moraxella lacunata]|uniref:hypothetical protein n=1 Tax=Moraxella lacunata TaxID=477 RepID=UPI001C12BFD8